MPYAHNGDCTLYYETFGDPVDRTLLLVNGLGSQCINYDEAWCAMFVARGFHVVRYDNRDVGLSTSFEGAPTGARGECYRISDMAADGLAVLDALGVHRAHVMGLSMGGMIVQTMAIEHPDRLLSMTSVMSDTGEPEFRRSSTRALQLLTAPPAIDREGFIRQWTEGLREWGSPDFADEARWRAMAGRAYDRNASSGGSARQYMAVGASAPRATKLREVQVPTLVVHGDRDTLIDQIGGRRTAELIPGARFEMIEGMGHDYPPQLWQRWVDLIVDFLESVPA